MGRRYWEFKWARLGDRGRETSGEGEESWGRERAGQRRRERASDVGGGRDREQAGEQCERRSNKVIRGRMEVYKNAENNNNSLELLVQVNKQINLELLSGNYELQ